MSHIYLAVCRQGHWKCFKLNYRNANLKVFLTSLCAFVKDMWNLVSFCAFWTLFTGPLNKHKHKECGDFKLQGFQHR